MVAPTDAVSEVPRVLGRYEVIGELARGGMASVHLGRVRGAGGFERIVAIKCCHPHLSGDPEFVAMFFDEARIAAGIHHPNVVATLDVGNDGPVLYQVMEYVEGVRLVDLVKASRGRDGTIPVPILARIMSDVLHGLHAAHELTDSSGMPLDVVHRDISPQNVMVGVDGVARIMDFGIARAAARSTVTDKGVVKGKFSYMAPEQLLAQDIDRRCDIFAAGVVLWEALVGKRLFAGDSQGETVQRVLHVPVERPSRVHAEAAPLDDIVMRALARPIEDRYPTALAFAEAIEASGVAIAKPVAVGAYVRETIGAEGDKKQALLRRVVLGTPTEATSPPTTQDPVAKPSPRRFGWAIALFALLVPIAIAVGVWTVMSAEEDPEPPPAALPAPVEPVPEPIVETPEPPPEVVPPVVAQPAEEEPPPAGDTPRRRRPRRTSPPPQKQTGSSPEYIPRSL